MTAPLKVRRIDHVALAVKDPARSVAWYREVLGLEQRHQEVWGGVPAMMYAGDTAVALFPASETAGATGLSSGGMRHLAFQAGRAEFAQAQVELAKRGTAFHFEDHQISHSIYFHDPDGYEIEITTYELRDAS